MKKLIAINALRVRSGGGVAHVKGILDYLTPQFLSDYDVHLWCNSRVALAVQDLSWLTIHTPQSTQGSIFQQVLYEKFVFPYLLRKYSFDLLFNCDAGSVARFHPMITLSQDLLSFEPGQISYYFPSFWLRLLVLHFVQVNTLRTSQSVIFLTQYANNWLLGIQIYPRLLTSYLMVLMHLFVWSARKATFLPTYNYLCL